MVHDKLQVLRGRVRNRTWWGEKVDQDITQEYISHLAKAVVCEVDAATGLMLNDPKWAGQRDGGVQLFRGFLDRNNLKTTAGWCQYMYRTYHKTNILLLR